VRKVIIFVTILAAQCTAQSWSNILASSRAIDWTHAGLPASFVDAETTPNPWTPPTRTQCVTASCNTLSGGTVTAASINAALASASTGQYVIIPNTSGCTVINNGLISLYAQSGVTLRGNGPQSTCLNLTGTTYIAFSSISSSGSCANWSAGYSQGSTSLTMSSCTGTIPVVGQVINLQECDSGYSGATCTTGSSSDNGGLYTCGDNPACSVTGGSSNIHQLQTVLVTSISGSGTYTVGFSPGLYLPNWSSSNTPFINWSGSSAASVTPYGNGLEDMTIYAANGTDSNNYLVGLTNSYGSWVKGVRFVGSGAFEAFFVSGCKNCLVLSNYIFSDLALDSNFPVAMQMTNGSDNLVLNNISASGVPWEGTGGNEGNVLAYNYGRDTFTMYYENQYFEHNAGSAFFLHEGQQTMGGTDDNVHGTHYLNTWFRNYMPGWDTPYLSCSGTCAPRGLDWDAYSRFENSVGNAIGSTMLTNYQSVFGSILADYVYQFDGAGNNDPLVLSTSLRWGNYDSVSAAIRWCGNSSDPGWGTTCSSTSEIPTSLSGNAVPFQNTVPVATNLPCSFFLTGYTSTTCTPHANGGTGLNWWKVCKAWSTFPTACSATQLQPFPPIGPDVSGGTYLSGYANDIPASIAFQNLPVDATYQNSYSITGSSWSGGTETLTVSGLPAGGVHIMGPMQISGGNCDTAGAEVYITTSNATTIGYARGSSASCSSGSVKFPDVRQFDERVYQNDPSNNPGAPASFFMASHDHPMAVMAHLGNRQQ
jgi:hypothetical protein